VFGATRAVPFRRTFGDILLCSLARRSPTLACLRQRGGESVSGHSSAHAPPRRDDRRARAMRAEAIGSIHTHARAVRAGGGELERAACDVLSAPGVQRDTCGHRSTRITDTSAAVLRLRWRRSSTDGQSGVRGRAGGDERSPRGCRAAVVASCASAYHRADHGRPMDGSEVTVR
jgi:hypothetical protein